MTKQRDRKSLEPIRNVLVVIDSSIQSGCPVLNISRLPLAEDAIITLLHVLPRGMSQGTRKRSETQTSESLRREAATISKTAGRAKEKG